MDAKTAPQGVTIAREFTWKKLLALLWSQAELLSKLVYDRPNPMFLAVTYGLQKREH